MLCINELIFCFQSILKIWELEKKLWQSQLKRKFLIMLNFTKLANNLISIFKFSLFISEIFGKDQNYSFFLCKILNLDNIGFMHVTQMYK